MFSGVGIICFAASYAVALLCDLPRGFSRRFRETPLLSRLARAVSLGFLIAGFIAHTAYLFGHHAVGLHHFVASEQAFCFLVAWGIIAICLHLIRLRPHFPLLMLLLPLALLLVAIGTYGASPDPFRETAHVTAFRTVHVLAFLATCLLLATGSAASLMYFEQARCLKRKRSPLFGMRLPSLEWSRTLAVSTFFGSLGCVFLGVLSGSVLAIGYSGTNIDPLMLWALTMLLLWIVLTVRGFLISGRQSRFEVAAPACAFLLLLLILLSTFAFRTAHWNTSGYSFTTRTNLVILNEGHFRSKESCLNRDGFAFHQESSPRRATFGMTWCLPCSFLKKRCIREAPREH